MSSGVGRFAILPADEAALLRAARINSLRFGRFPLAPRAQSSWFRSFKAATPGSVKRAGVPKGEKHGGRAIVPFNNLQSGKMREPRSLES